MVKKVAVLGVGMLLLGGTTGVAEDTVAAKFKTFCSAWMQKLAAREDYNRALIAWQVGPDGVRGEFVGYSAEHDCKLVRPTSAKGTPVGKIIYREMRYRQTGRSTAQAAESKPRIVELTEVTEIFRYAGGKWIY